MPRYNYQCSSCDTFVTIIHLIDEEIDFCTNCKQFGTMVKQLTKPTLSAKQDNSKKTVGVLTKEYIELNKELLEEEKLKARSELYDKT